MHRVQLMTQTPPSCLTCGRGNTPDDPDTMDEFWVLDLERDVNWGDSTYICKYCVDEIAAISGLVTTAQLDEAQQIIEAIRKKLHNKTSELEQFKEKVRAKFAGDRAAAEIAKATAPKKKSRAKKAA